MDEFPQSNIQRKNHQKLTKNSYVKNNFTPMISAHDDLSSSLEKKVGDSFVKQGELRLLHGDISGIQFFDLAIQLDPGNPKLYFDQGLSILDFASEKGNEKSLLIAAKRFKAAVKLNPNYFEAWHSWGNTLYLLGKTFEEHHYFLEAEQKYKQALLLSSDQTSDILADLYWNYGCVWATIADRSNEPSDMHLALDAFNKTVSLQEDMSIEFWHDFGHICLKLGTKLNDLRFFLKSINCYKNAVSLSISSYDSWLNLACSLKTLYSFTHDEDHFTQANECFSTAAQLNSKDPKLWINWARILNISGRLIKDSKRLRSAIEKCRKAQYVKKSPIPEISAIWSEALSVLGLLNDKVDLIYMAQNKILDVMDSYPHIPELYHSFGLSLYALGSYFNDLDYYYQAIEKFQEGLTIDRTKHELWHALGYTYCIVGQLEDDNKTFDKAYKFFLKAIALQGNSTYYYDFAYSLLKYGEIINDQKTLELAKTNFEQALTLQKNAVYLHPDWLFNYGVCLDLLGGFTEERSLFQEAIDVLNHVLMIDPDFPSIHYQMALTYTHLAEITSDLDTYQSALHYYRLAHKRDEENDIIILDWSLTLISLGDELQDSLEAEFCFKEAEFKLTQSAKLGNIHAYYHLSCLYSLLNELEKSMHFLYKAKEFEALPPNQELLEDDWLENLRTTSMFQSFFFHLESQSKVDD